MWNDQLLVSSRPLGGAEATLVQTNREEETQPRVSVPECELCYRDSNIETGWNSTPLITTFKMTKTKKEKVCVDGEEAAELPAAAEGNGKSYHELVANVNPIAQPLASKKLSKKLYKCVKKGKSRHS